ncbi:MAG TPA: hypothetical protein VHS57_03840 [Acidimicrobiales bacterium]|nr:hypothetical protein [Acidimicrobiales bacterium]
MLSLIIGLILFALFFVGWIQIITKAGYSAWWIVVPLSLPILWLITITVAFNGINNSLGNYGAFNFQAFQTEAEVLGGLTLVDLILNFALFLVFAFSEWPVIREARTGSGPRGGGYGWRGPSYGPGAVPGPRPGPPVGFGVAAGFPVAAPPPDAHAPGLEPGWHRSGSVGSGEQSYWDGSAWSARRRWTNGAWVDLTMAGAEAVAPEPGGASTPPQL